MRREGVHVVVPSRPIHVAPLAFVARVVCGWRDGSSRVTGYELPSRLLGTHMLASVAAR